MNLMESGWNIEKPFLNDNIRASSRGLVVKAENPHYGDPQCLKTHSFLYTCKKKICNFFLLVAL